MIQLSSTVVQNTLRPNISQSAFVIGLLRAQLMHGMMVQLMAEPSFAGSMLVHKH